MALGWLLEQVTHVVDRLAFQLALNVTVALTHRFVPMLLLVALVGIAVFVVVVRTLVSNWRRDAPAPYINMFWIFDQTIVNVNFFVLYVLVQVVVDLVSIGIDGNHIFRTFAIVLLIGLMVFTIFHVLDRYREVRADDVAALADIARMHPLASEAQWIDAARIVASQSRLRSLHALVDPHGAQ